MPSFCTICGGVYCYHTRTQRGLTPEEWDLDMSRDLTSEEQALFQSDDDEIRIQAARKAFYQTHRRIAL